MKRTSIGCLATLFLFLALVSLPYVLHNWGLHRFRAYFAQVTHPATSTALHDISAVGLLEGNGNHCDYFAGQFRETDLSPEDVRRYYATSRVHRVDPGGYDSGFGDYVPVYLAFLETQASDISHLIDVSTLAAVHAKRTHKTLYFVYSLDIGYDPNFDLRCY